MRTQILKWVRRQDFYWDEVLGLNDEEDVDAEEEDQEEEEGDQSEVVQQQNVVEQQNNVVEQQQNVVEQQPNVLEDRLKLASRITALENFFEQLKESKERRERDASREGSSGSNQFG